MKIKFLLSVALLVAMSMPLTGCIPMAIGYLAAKAMEKPQIVTTSCTIKDPQSGVQQCTTVTS